MHLQPDAGFHNIRRQSVDFDVTIVADKEASGGVEYDDALRHMIERQFDKVAFSAEPAEETGEAPEHHAAADRIARPVVVIQQAFTGR